MGRKRRTGRVDEQFLPEPEPTAISTCCDASADAISTTRTNVAGDAGTGATSYSNTCTIGRDTRGRDRSRPYAVHGAYSDSRCYGFLSHASVTPASTACEQSW